MDFLVSIIDFLAGTGVAEQIRAVDVRGLFTNPWFMVPFVGFLGYNLYKQAVKVLVITALALGLWVFSGSPMMDGLIIDNELQLSKVLPVAGVGLVAVAVAVYFLIMRD
ncbi:hypothetical protein ACHHRT_12780 [Desulfurivibrio sp. D14AmB]|uniref:hypothetical protein n=1 Tax=Desulfurivibrio sp. D14AmB TaxID=3374370 RepID=UPI00376EB142